jgi:hypothetical protein
MLQRLEKTDAELHRILGDFRNRSAWDDTFVGALCEPAETFTFGGVFAHIVTFNVHRRLMALALAVRFFPCLLFTIQQHLVESVGQGLAARIRTRSVGAGLDSCLRKF